MVKWIDYGACWMCEEDDAMWTECIDCGNAMTTCCGCTWCDAVD